jgi:hypothetical protein
VTLFNSGKGTELEKVRERLPVSQTVRGAIVKLMSIKKLQFPGTYQLYGRELKSFELVEKQNIKTSGVSSAIAACGRREAPKVVSCNTNECFARMPRGVFSDPCGPYLDAGQQPHTTSGATLKFNTGKGSRNRPADTSELESRRNAWTALAGNGRAVRNCTDQAGTAPKRAVTHPGGKAEVVR